jgi:DNA-binding response OmpR family regulator
MKRAVPMAELQCAETSGHRVLIIEDEGMVAMLLEDMLTNLGYEVVAIAGRMERAAELVTRADIDVAILDVNLNGELTYSLASALGSGGA